MHTHLDVQDDFQRRRGIIIHDYLDVYTSASKRDKGSILDEIVVMTGWSRDHVRRRLAQLAHGPKLSPTEPVAQQRAAKYSDDSKAILEQVWDWSGRQSGKYLAAIMPLLLEALERHGSLVPGQAGYSSRVREELLSVSPASVDRYLRCARACDFATRSVSTRRSSAPSEAFLRFAGGENETEPGFFMTDTVAHPGWALAGDYLFTLNATCVHTGWVFTKSIADNSPLRIADLLQEALDEITGIPFWVNAVELSNKCARVHETVGEWASELDIHYSPIVKDHQRDLLPGASKHQHLVHEYGSLNRYDTEEARGALNHLWRAVNDRLNFFTPTRKPIAWVKDPTGHRKRIYDEPVTPLDRLRKARVLAPVQEAELLTYRDSLNPARLTLDIARWQDHLKGLALPLR